MRAPNGQGCSINGGITLAVVQAGDTVWRCEDIFKQAVESNKPVRFEFTSADLKALAEYYPGINREITRVRTFLNSVIVMQKNMCYEISTVFRDMGSNTFLCRMVKEPSQDN